MVQGKTPTKQQLGWGCLWETILPTSMQPLPLPDASHTLDSSALLCGSNSLDPSCLVLLCLGI